MVFDFSAGRSDLIGHRVVALMSAEHDSCRIQGRAHTSLQHYISRPRSQHQQGCRLGSSLRWQSASRREARQPSILCRLEERPVVQSARCMTVIATAPSRMLAHHCGCGWPARARSARSRSSCGFCAPGWREAAAPRRSRSTTCAAYRRRP